MNHLVVAEVKILIDNNVSNVDLSNTLESSNSVNKSLTMFPVPLIFTDPSQADPAVADLQC